MDTHGDHFTHSHSKPLLSKEQIQSESKLNFALKGLTVQWGYRTDPNNYAEENSYYQEKQEISGEAEGRDYLSGMEEQSLELRHGRPGTLALLMWIWTETCHRTKTGFMGTMAEQSSKPSSKGLPHMTIF